jgi:hypothetical protein
MTKLILVRYPEYKGSTPGAFYYDKTLICYSLERPWLDNQRNISCIPLGIYPLEITMSGRFKKMLPLIHPVPGRSGIRIHAANHVRELEGCIAPCRQLLIEDKEVTGWYSQQAMSKVLGSIQQYKITTLEVTHES